MRKNKFMKKTAIILSAGLVLGSVGVVSANSTFGTGSIPFSLEDGQTATINATSITARQISKEETVYTFTAADGSVKKVLVSSWLKNPNKETTLTDVSDLVGITNIKGDETFTSNADGSYTWNAAGNDIYYRGESQKATPVSFDIIYTLDGKTVTPEELAGKSGKVTITYRYKNNEITKDQVHVPFVMVTGMLLDNEVFQNVSIDYGKLINDGDRSYAVGVGFPGMSEDLTGIKELSLELPSSFTITADVSNFKLGMTVTFASTLNMLSDLLPEDLEEVSEVKASLTRVTEAMTALMDGSSSMYDGLEELLKKTGELEAGVKTLYDGSVSLAGGANDLKNGASSLLEGAGSLAGGLGQITQNNESLVAGSTQVFESLLAMANDELGKAGLSVGTLTIENYDAVLTQIIASLSDDAIPNAKAYREKLTVTLEQLRSYQTFHLGLVAYTEGVSQAAAGANTLYNGSKNLVSGTDQLLAGANSLSAGLGTLNESMPKLLEGISALKDGAGKISDGLSQFNEEAVDKIADLVNGDLTTLVNELKAVAKAGSEYASFTGNQDGEQVTTKFIFRTEGIEVK